MKELDTINVIEVDGGVVLSMFSYEDNEEGNRLAEIKFYDMVVENFKNIVKEDIKSYIEDGSCWKGNYGILLVHST